MSTGSPVPNGSYTLTPAGPDPDNWFLAAPNNLVTLTQCLYESTTTIDLVIVVLCVGGGQFTIFCGDAETGFGGVFFTGTGPPAEISNTLSGCLDTAQGSGGTASLSW